MVSKSLYNKINIKKGIFFLKSYYLQAISIVHERCVGKSSSQARAVTSMPWTEAGDILLTGLSV